MRADSDYQLSDRAAETYEAKKVPAIFAPLAEQTLDAVALPEGARVLDIACGTGVVSRAVGARLTRPSPITGLDLNAGMLLIAAREGVPPPHEGRWAEAPVDAMPFEAGSFDLAFCQQGIQFFPETAGALAEMRRVLAPGGRLVLTVWAGVPPLFDAIAEALLPVLGAEAARTARAPFTFIADDGTALARLVAEAGFAAPRRAVLRPTRRLDATPEALVPEILASPNEPLLSAAGPAAIAALSEAVHEALQPFRAGEALVLPQEALLLEARCA
ncbi:MAG: methyltransferase domain-containing protein [Pseudomonadota bacterium]